MENLKKGDVVELGIDLTFNLKKGQKGVIKKEAGVLLCVDFDLHTFPEFVKKIGESKMQYEESNCYKLKRAIGKTGISSKKLSLAITQGKTISHFYSNTKKSRLTDRGDISEARLNELLTDLAFAERELLGVGAKTVETTEKDWLDEAVEYTGTLYDEGKPKSNKPLFIGASVVISIVLILFILNNYLQVV